MVVVLAIAAIVLGALVAFKAFFGISEALFRRQIKRSIKDYQAACVRREAFLAELVDGDDSSEHLLVVFETVRAKLETIGTWNLTPEQEAVWEDHMYVLETIDKQLVERERETGLRLRAQRLLKDVQ